MNSRASCAFDILITVRNLVSGLKRTRFHPRAESKFLIGVWRDKSTALTSHAMLHGSASQCSCKSMSSRSCFKVNASAKGFGKTAAKKKKTQKPQFKEGDDSWVRVGKIDDFQGKQIKAVELKDKSIVALYQIGDDVFCSDANSTAYKFPLTNANIVERNGGPAVEVALDGTVYDLQTGKVLEWCPKNNILRSLLGTLKSNQDPENLKVYPAEVDDGNIFVKFS